MMKSKIQNPKSKRGVLRTLLNKIINAERSRGIHCWDLGFWKLGFKNAKGFTLVELVMAVVISGVAIYALLTVFINAAYRNVDVEALSMGFYLANARLEEVSNQSYAAITDQAITPFGGDFSDFSYEVMVDDVSAEALNVPTGSPSPESYRRIKVIVTSINLPSSIEVITLVTDASNE